MKIVITILSALFSALETTAQIVLSPLTLLTIVGLFAFTALMGRQVRKGHWRTDASWNKAA